MNTKTLSALVATLSLAAAGVAFAQANPPTSTSGAGCTATANAMRGGNLGSTPTNKDCVSTGATAAAVTPAPMAATTTTTTETAAAPARTTQMADSTAMGNTGAKKVKPMRVARADRN